MAEIEASLLARLERLGAELDKRASKAQKLDAYVDGEPPIPAAVAQAKATKAYTMLMNLAGSNWAKLVVDSVDERLEVQGFRGFGNEEADKAAWGIWQRNALDEESSLIHQAALANGRAYAIVWADRDGKATITPEPMSTTIVEYAPGSRRQRVAAMRRWDDDGRLYATLYLPDALYKFQQKTGPGGTPVDGWERREVDSEPWPLPNPLGEVPVVEFAVNRKLRSGSFGFAMGEFEDSLGHIDRINYTVFAWIVAMTWSGFPLRAQIGDPILYEDDGVTPIRPFDVSADRVVQIENPDGKLIQLPEATLTNYIESAQAHIQHFAAITKTPAHYLLGELVNISADAIRAAEAGLNSKTNRHKKGLGGSHETMVRLSGKVEGNDALAGGFAGETIWKNLESRSDAERADAATKLKDIMPWQALAERFLDASPTEIGRWEQMRASEGLLQQLTQPPVPPAP